MYPLRPLAVPLDIHLVPHTHWDREWYHPLEVFRQRLVDLIDELIDAPPGEGESFLLDGQGIVVEDYLAVRPERREALGSLLRRGRLEAGPWFVLADELIPGGEALVRNLLLGRAALAAFDAAAPPVLYCPDSFGHPAILPDLAAGFGLPLVILWRGYGGSRWPKGDVVRWRGPSGAEAIVFHLPPDGYEFGSSLPADPEAAKLRWRAIRSTLAGRSTVSVTLLQNGADHHARQESPQVAYDLARTLAAETGDDVHVSSLTAFARTLVARAERQRLQVIEGELRDSYGYAWTLQGTLGTRAGQKRANAVAERDLLRAERWAAVAWWRKRVDLRPHLRAGWRTLLEAHPHDTLCGTSVDEVARAADVRLQSAAQQGDAITARVIADLAGRPPNARPVDHPAVIVRNDRPRRRGGVALITLFHKLADEPVGPGSANGPDIEELKQLTLAMPLPRNAQVLSARIRRNRSEGPRRYPDNDIVNRVLIACLVEPMDGMSIRPLDLHALPQPAERVRATSRSLESDRVSVTIDADGSAVLSSGDHRIDDLLRIDDRADQGDLYTPSIRGEPASFTRRKAALSQKGPLVAELRQQIEIKQTATKIDLHFRLISGAERLEIVVRTENGGKDHRVRLGFATGVANARVVADAAFGPTDRKAPSVSAEDLEMETPPPTAPLHRYVSLFAGLHGATIHSDGLAEYEADADGVVWITLVRAVGELSRNKLPERPGHAGWPAATPGGQMIGSFEARFAIQLHGGLSQLTLDAIERESDDFLEPLRGETLRESETCESVAGFSLSGLGLRASAAKIAEDGASVVLRSVNVTSQEQQGVWGIPGDAVSATYARLDETPTGDVEVQGRSIAFTAPARAITTLLVKPSASFSEADR